MHKEGVLAHAVFIGQKQGIKLVQISRIQQEKLIGREAMKAIFDASKTMARQGIAFRGHIEVDLNFYQIIRLISRNGRLFKVLDREEVRLDKPGVSEWNTDGAVQGGN